LTSAQTRAGLFSKGFSHNTSTGDLDATGIVEFTRHFADYIKSLDRVNDGNDRYLKSVDLLSKVQLYDNTSPFRLTDPQASSTVTLLGGYSTCFHSLPPPPLINSDNGAMDLLELYGMDLMRDTPFAAYEQIDDNNNIATAPVLSPDQKTWLTSIVTDINAHLSSYIGPRNSLGVVTPSVLFRGTGVGELFGPLASQFLFADIHMGALTIAPQHYQMDNDNSDFNSNKATMLALQNGIISGANPPAHPHYVNTLRDLASLVHNDPLYQFPFQAALILKQTNVAPNPLWISPTTSLQQSADGISMYFPENTGFPSVISAIGTVSTMALDICWFFKWRNFVRLRPEAYSIWVQDIRDGTTPSNPYQIPSWLVNSTTVNNIFTKHGSWLLSTAYHEGCPGHPSYPAGHATVAGACITLLKAFYRTDQNWTSATGLTVQEASLVDPTLLQPYTGDTTNVTVEGELNKLATNVAMGRNAAGIHYRSDYQMSCNLGEEIAIQYLKDVLASMPDRGESSIIFHRFDGTPVTVKPSVV
jgi:hypothetical protein